MPLPPTKLALVLPLFVLDASGRVPPDATPRVPQHPSVAIDTVARQYGLGFIALQEEHYNFIVPKASLDRPALRVFRALLTDRTVQEQLRQMGFRL